MSTDEQDARIRQPSQQTLPVGAGQGGLRAVPVGGVTRGTVAGRWFAGVVDCRLTSRDQLWAEVQQLRDLGLSVRQIGARLGISRMKAHRLVSAPPAWAATDDDGDDAEPPALFSAAELPEFAPPFLYAGCGRVWLPGAKGDDGCWGREYRIVDASGTGVPWLDFWRWCEYRRNDHDDPETADTVWADMAVQIAAAERRTVRRV